jgi:hypothetical protein
MEIPERFMRVGEAVKKRFRLTVKKFDNKKDVWPYAKDIFMLLNRAYENLYGYVPLTDRQIDYYVNMYIPMLRLNFLSLVLREEDNKIVGVGIGLPSLAKALQKAEGKFLPTGWYHLSTLERKNKTGARFVVDRRRSGIRQRGECPHL